MKKTAFVTGATGFLGRHLIELLVAEQWEITTIVRGAVPAWMAESKLTIHRGSLDQAIDVLNAMPQNADAVFHLAGNISMWTGDLAAITRDNIDATRNLLQAAVQKNAKAVVMTSTLGVFEEAKNAKGGIAETDRLQVKGNKNPYLNSKIIADELLTATAAAHKDIQIVSLHPSHMLGKYDAHGWISLFDDAVNGKLKLAPPGDASFCSARAVAGAHIAAARHPAPARRYVLGGNKKSYLQLFAAIANCAGTKPVTKLAPAFLLKTLAQLAQWQSTISGKKPAMTPGLASVLTGTMIGNSALAHEDLSYETLELEALLDEAYTYWKINR